MGKLNNGGRTTLGTVQTAEGRTKPIPFLLRGTHGEWARTRGFVSLPLDTRVVGLSVVSDLRQMAILIIRRVVFRPGMITLGPLGMGSCAP